MCWVFQQFGGNAGQRRTFLSHKGALAGTPHLFNIPFIFQIKILSLQQTGCLIFPSFLQFYSCLLVFLKFSNFVPVFSQKWNFKPSYKPLKEKHWYSLKYNNNASVSSIFISVILICTFLLPRHTFERKSAGFFFLFFFFLIGNHCWLRKQLLQVCVVAEFPKRMAGAALLRSTGVSRKILTAAHGRAKVSVLWEIKTIPIVSKRWVPLNTTGAVSRALVPGTKKKFAFLTLWERLYTVSLKT